MLEFIIIGAIIGAGFASGKEIYIFFYKYGMEGFLGIILCSLLIGILLYKILKLIIEYKIKNYDDFLRVIFKNKFLKYSNKILMNIFLLISFFIMIAGFGAYLNQEYEFNYIIGASILSIICFFVFLKGADGVDKVSNVLVPILIVFIIIIGANNFKNINEFKNILNIQNTNSNLYNNWITQSIIYSSYNLILLIPLLVNYYNKLNRKNIIRISIVTGIAIFILLNSIFWILSIAKSNIITIEMPAIYIIGREYSGLKRIYGIVILLSIITTAISEGLGFIEAQKVNKKDLWRISLIICFFGVLVSKMGFSTLVRILYPTIGFLGLIQMFYICKKE